MKNKIVALFAVMLGVVSAVAQTAGSMYDENYFVKVFKEQDKVKPSYVGIFHKDTAPRLMQLMLGLAKEWGLQVPGSEEEMKALGKTPTWKENVPDLSNSAQQKKIAEIEVDRKKALKDIDKLPDGYVDKAKLKKEINDNFDKMLAQIPGAYQQSQQRVAESERENRKDRFNFDGMQVSAETIQEYVAYLDDFASQLTLEQRADLKEKVRQLAVGKKLWKEARGFRYGRAAVCNENGWGFIDTNGNEVIPCKYAQVYNFRNQNHTLSEAMSGNKDKDSRMWTTVVLAVKGVGYNAGMVDANGREVIPCNFIFHDSGYDEIVFLQTPWGEYARVQERASKKHGIIDRNGNYTLPPTYEQIIHWDEDRQCFSIFDWDAKRYVYIDYKGSVL